MVKDEDIIAALQSIVDNGVINCANIANSTPLTIAIPVKVFNDACEILAGAKNNGITRCE